ncbi:hypothetical protein D6777_01105 [Candidatus Woesearchaeota archaeon]|nr:MAG: hypothetical protein D6777_01105 [Candidatus Woesearchaeota archaeon]
MTSLEIKRQLFHLIFSIILVILIYLDIVGPVVLSSVLIIGLVLSYLSIEHKLPAISWLLNVFERDNVNFPGEGAFYLILGITIVVLFFPLNIALASIMILALGDSFANLLGRAYGKKPFAHKTLVGTTAGIFFGFWGAMIFVEPLVALLGSGITMLLEAFNLKVLNIKIDDNLFIPVVASIIMYVWVML